MIPPYFLQHFFNNEVNDEEKSLLNGQITFISANTAQNLGLTRFMLCLMFSKHFSAQNILNSTKILIDAGLPGCQGSNALDFSEIIAHQAMYSARFDVMDLLKKKLELNGKSLAPVFALPTTLNHFLASCSIIEFQQMLEYQITGTFTFKDKLLELLQRGGYHIYEKPCGEGNLAVVHKLIEVLSSCEFKKNHQHQMYYGLLKASQNGHQETAKLLRKHIGSVPPLLKVTCGPAPVQLYKTKNNYAGSVNKIYDGRCEQQRKPQTPSFIGSHIWPQNKSLNEQYEQSVTDKMVGALFCKSPNRPEKITQLIKAHGASFFIRAIDDFILNDSSQVQNSLIAHDFFKPSDPTMFNYLIEFLSNKNDQDRVSKLTTLNLSHQFIYIVSNPNINLDFLSAYERSLADNNCLDFVLTFNEFYAYCALYTQSIFPDRDHQKTTHKKHLQIIKHIEQLLLERNLYKQAIDQIYSALYNLIHRNYRLVKANPNYSGTLDIFYHLLSNPIFLGKIVENIHYNNDLAANDLEAEMFKDFIYFKLHDDLYYAFYPTENRVGKPASSPLTKEIAFLCLKYLIRSSREDFNPLIDRLLKLPQLEGGLHQNIDGNENYPLVLEALDAGNKLALASLIKVQEVEQWLQDQPELEKEINQLLEIKDVVTRGRPYSLFSSMRPTPTAENDANPISQRSLCRKFTPKAVEIDSNANTHDQSPS